MLSQRVELDKLLNLYCTIEGTDKTHVVKYYYKNILLPSCW